VIKFFSGKFQFPVHVEVYSLQAYSKFIFQQASAACNQQRPIISAENYTDKGFSGIRKEAVA